MHQKKTKKKKTQLGQLPLKFFLCADLEGSGLASDCPVSGSVWAPLCLRAGHVDHQGQGKGLQETICGLR